MTRKQQSEQLLVQLEALRNALGSVVRRRAAERRVSAQPECQHATVEVYCHDLAALVTNWSPTAEQQAVAIAEQLMGLSKQLDLPSYESEPEYSRLEAAVDNIVRTCIAIKSPGRLG
jgi:hypothetical protein